MIYIPSSAEYDAGWVSSDVCVWTAPEWLEAKTRLDGVLKFTEYEHLFRIILKIGDANWRDYLSDLKMVKEQSHTNTDRVVEIYGRLWREFERDSSWAVLW